MNARHAAILLGRIGGRATGKRKARSAEHCRAAQRASVAARKLNAAKGKTK